MIPLSCFPTLLFPTHRYVTLQGNSFQSPEVQVNAGDAIFGNMTRLGADTYFIDSVVVSNGKSTSLKPKQATLASQPWAYVTLEYEACCCCRS